MAVAQAREQTGAYVVEAGWRVLAPPASSEEEWAEQKQSFKWTGRRLAHFWTVDGVQVGKWDTASYRGKDKTTGALKFYYKSDRLMAMTHSLALADYGLTGYWVIIEKDDA